MIPTNEDRTIWIRAKEFDENNSLEYLKAMPMNFNNMMNKKLLDYGCGGGRDVSVFYNKEIEVYGVDIVKENIEKTKKRIKENNAIYLEDSSKLPFDDEYFDYITSNGVIHHIEYPKDVVQELKRVLKINGYAYIMLYTEMLENYHLGKIKTLISDNVSFNKAFGTLTDQCNYSRSYTVEQAKELFEGFELLEYKDYFNNYFRIYKFRRIK